MFTENDLLIDLIKYCPIGSIWHITADSWKELSRLLQDFSRRGETDICVTIDDKNRATVLELVVRYELSEKIVHHSILDLSGNYLMDSWDHMSLTHVSRAFPNLGYITLKYGDMDYFGILE